MKAKELRELTDEELQQKLREIKQEQFNLQLQQVTGRLENPARVKQLRRTVARIKTILNERRAGE